MNGVRKVAIVTGASRGIGAALVSGFRDHGYAVVATARSIAPSDDPNIAVVAGDIADRVCVDQVVQTAITRFGRIDTLVNNAGIFMSKPFTDYTDADFDAMVATNLSGFFRMTRAAVTEMLKSGSGHVVSITPSLTDQAMLQIPSGLANLTKGGINSATKALAVEFAARGIRVNAVSPGIIDTPMHVAEAHGFLSALHPVKRMGKVSDIVQATLYLDQADFVTGEILHVDGGQSAGW